MIIIFFLFLMMIIIQIWWWWFIYYKIYICILTQSISYLFTILYIHIDNNGMTWGIVCCQWQFDPCWLPRQITHILCFCVPCGCIAEETILTVCCCNPGKYYYYCCCCSWFDLILDSRIIDDDVVMFVGFCFIYNDYHLIWSYLSSL